MISPMDMRSPLPDVAFLPYTTRTRVSLAIARSVAAGRGDRDVTPLHVALGLLREGENPAVSALMHADVDVRALRADIERALGHPPGAIQPDAVAVDLTEGEKQIVEMARSISRTLGDEYLGPAHLLLAVLSDENGQATTLFAQRGITASTAREHLDAVMMRHSHPTDPPSEKS